MKNTIRENALLLAAHMRETAEEIEYCDDYCSHGVAVAKKETTTGADINVPTNGGEKDGHDQWRHQNIAEVLCKSRLQQT